MSELPNSKGRPHVGAALDGPIAAMS